MKRMSRWEKVGHVHSEVVLGIVGERRERNSVVKPRVRPQSTRGGGWRRGFVWKRERVLEAVGEDMLVVAGLGEGEE